MLKYPMAFLIFIFIAFLFLIIFVFSSKKLSPIPYFPSNKKDIASITKALGLSNNQTIFDLGAGDGIIIFAAAKVANKKKLNTKFVAVEINPILILILLIRLFFHPNKKNIKIIRDDIFKMKLSFPTTNYSLLTTFYLYISPWFLEKVAKKILHEFPKAKIISYMYPIKSLKNSEKKIQGKNTIFVYR